MFLRRGDAPAGAKQTDVGGEPPSWRPRTVLLVDDQEEVREATAGLLVALGCRCIPAASGPLALDLLTGTAGIDMLLVDYAMPVMVGTDVIASARLARPDLAIVLMTGYADADSLRERLQELEILKKPFRRHELDAALNRALRRRQRARSEGNVVRLDPPRV